MVADLDISLQLSTPSGWLECEDETNGYTVHADTLNSRGVTHRTSDAKGDWVGGSFAHRSVPENVTETLAIWVEGYGSVYDFRTKLAALEAVFHQLRWNVKLKINDLLETWQVAEPADYTITSSGPLFVATTGYITAQVARLPALTLEAV